MKGELKHARRKHMNKGTEKEKKKKNQINKKKKKKKKGGQYGTQVNACGPVRCSRREPPVSARDLAGLSKDRQDRGEMA
jgi:hypothetical protein